MTANIRKNLVALKKIRKNLNKRVDKHEFVYYIYGVT